jgi:hypothetical protein
VAGLDERLHLSVLILPGQEIKKTAPDKKSGYGYV